MKKFLKVPIILNEMFVFLQCKILDVQPWQIFNFVKSLCKYQFFTSNPFLYFLLAAFSMNRNKAKIDSRLSMFIIISSDIIHNKTLAWMINIHVLDVAHPGAAYFSNNVLVQCQQTTAWAALSKLCKLWVILRNPTVAGF